MPNAADRRCADALDRAVRTYAAVGTLVQFVATVVVLLKPMDDDFLSCGLLLRTAAIASYLESRDRPVRQEYMYSDVYVLLRYLKCRKMHASLVC